MYINNISWFLYKQSLFEPIIVGRSNNIILIRLLWLYFINIFMLCDIEIMRKLSTAGFACRVYILRGNRSECGCNAIQNITPVEWQQNVYMLWHCYLRVSSFPLYLYDSAFDMFWNAFCMEGGRVGCSWMRYICIISSLEM